MTRAEVTLDYAQRRYEVMVRIYGRIRRLAKQGAAPEEELDRAELAYLDAEYALALARLDAASLQPPGAESGGGVPAVPAVPATEPTEQ